MTEPKTHVRAVTYERDGHRCVSCGAFTNLQFQHRQATGMGGSRVRPLFVDGVTSCARCNPRYESDLHQAALRFGWKVPRWVDAPGLVPVWCVWARSWFRLTRVGTREPVSGKVALEMMHEVYGPQYDEWMQAA
jgi:hypothetical protein